MLDQKPRNPAKKHRVLVVDDDPVVLKIAGAVLSTDMDVVTCTEGRQALRLVEAEDFHVVCADYMMRGMNGVELLENVARLKPHIGCLLVTGSDDYFRSEERKDYFVLLKPFNPERLLSIVGQMARIAEMKRPSMPPESTRREPPDSRIRIEHGPSSSPPSRRGGEGKS
jgi:DNA-binding NtrC family response regulator